MKNNPFKELSIAINPKALFQDLTFEAKQVEVEKRIEVLAKIIYAGYDLNKVVHRYLQGKVALTDEARKDEIINTFNRCTFIILDKALEKKEFSPDFFSPEIKNLFKTVYGGENKPEKLQDAINAFVIAIKELVHRKEDDHRKEEVSIRDLVIAYFDNSQNYSVLSSAIGIDLEEDLTYKLQIRDKEEATQTLWRYSALYSWYKLDLFPNLRSNRIKYMNPSFQMPMVQIYNVFIKKYFPLEDHDKLNNDENFRKERLLDFAEKVIRVLWLNEPLFDEPIYLVRCNYTEKSASELEYLYENNIVSICIQKEETKDQNYFNELIKGNNPAFDNTLSYIQRFLKLVDSVREQDVIVMASFLGKNHKIGLIKKGSEMFCKEGKEFKLFCLKMKSVYCTPTWGKEFESIDLRTYPILKSIIPQQTTISAIKKRKNAIYGIYYGVKYPLNLSLMTDSAIEKMCAEWLRSRFASESYRICYQIVRTGGNFADVDILGANNQNQIIAAQVSNTTDNNLVSKKIDKLKSFSSDEKIIFSNVHRPDLEKISDCLNIFIGDVWDDFHSDSYYKIMLERFVAL